MASEDLFNHKVQLFMSEKASLNVFGPPHIFSRFNSQVVAVLFEFCHNREKETLIYISMSAKTSFWEFATAPVTLKECNIIWMFACMHAHDWGIDCVFVWAKLCEWLAVHIYFIWADIEESDGVKLKLHPLSGHHNPPLFSSSAGLHITIQILYMCASFQMHFGFPGCRSFSDVCTLESMRVFSLSIKIQYSFEIWQLQIAHIMTARRR